VACPADYAARLRVCFEQQHVDPLCMQPVRASEACDSGADHDRSRPRR